MQLLFHTAQVTGSISETEKPKNKITEGRKSAVQSQILVWSANARLTNKKRKKKRGCGQNVWICSV